MIYTVFVSIPQKLEIQATSPEEAERLIREQLVKSGQIRATDWIDVNVATDIDLEEK